MIQKFDGEFPVSHLRFTVSSDLKDNINAQTSSPENYVIEIKVNRNNLDRPELSIARTLIHETIHAEIFRKLLSLSNRNGRIDGARLQQALERGDFPGLLDYYTRYGENFDHPQMAAHYIKVMSDMLEEFDNNQHPQELYEALSWVGLKGTREWERKSQRKKDRINDIIYRFKVLDYENGLED